jgi:O-antigen/teichoic acid export membrane protein
MTIAQRSITSSAYTISSNLIQLVLNLVRSIALARLLFPEVFGVYIFISSIVTLTQALPNFGLTGAFLSLKQLDQEEALKTHFTLNTAFHAVWAVVLLAGAWLLAAPETRWAYWTIVAASFLYQITQTPRALLTRRVEFRRIALMETISTVIDSAVAIGMALAGYGLWSLLVANLTGSLVQVLALFFIRPVWKPALGLSNPIARQFLSFGSKVWSGAILLQALDRVDDIWTGYALGDAALGFYSRAYRFATYPRKVLSKPLNEVALGAYAGLKEERLKLSQAFFRVNALMVRGNFLLAGLMVLVAPEFIRIVLGERWLPMLEAFRLMLVYTLLDPIKLMVSNLLITSGAPEKVTAARLVQLVVMLAGLVTLGPWLGIAGVALAVDLMMLVGIVILFREARRFVDYSAIKLFGRPLLALVPALALAFLAVSLPGLPGGAPSDWVTAAVKAVVFTLVYSLLLFLQERRDLPVLLNLLRSLRSVQWK